MQHSPQNESTEKTPDGIATLLHHWAQQHLAQPTRARQEKQYISITEVMSYLHTSAGRIDPEAHFDSENVLNRIEASGYQVLEMAGTVHIAYY